MLALSPIIGNEDRFQRLGLIANALKILEPASPSLHKVELALLAAALLAKDEPQRAFETLATAAKYANSLQPKTDLPAGIGMASGIRLDVTVVNMRTILSRRLERFVEIEIDHTLFALSRADWFQAQQTVNTFKDTELRLLLKLQMAESVLTYNVKKKPDGAQKPRQE